MALGNLQGRAYTDPSAPEAPGIDDRSGFKYLHHELQWQYQWCGNKLQNLRILVYDPDIPQEQLRPIILPPDPVPILNPRPGFYAQQEGPPPAPFPPPAPPTPQPSYLELEGGMGVIEFEGGGGIIELE